MSNLNYNYFLSIRYHAFQLGWISLLKIYFFFTYINCWDLSFAQRPNSRVWIEFVGVLVTLRYYVVFITVKYRSISCWFVLIESYQYNTKCVTIVLLIIHNTFCVKITDEYLRYIYVRIYEHFVYCLISRRKKNYTRHVLSSNCVAVMHSEL